MTKSNSLPHNFLRCKKRKIEFNFAGGNVSSDGGALLLKGVDEKIGLTKAIARSLEDVRRSKSCQHSIVSMLRQRVYGLACGYEDLNDQVDLRHDIALQAAANTDKALASPSTLSRFENSVTWEDIVEIQKHIVESFINSYERPPKELILDFDSTDHRIHGNQDGRHFHRKYDSYVFLPLYVFCGEKLLVSYLREGWAQCHYHAGAILRLLVNRLRKEWPQVRIIFRADAGFAKGTIFSWCERNEVNYIVGIQSYAPFKTKAMAALASAKMKHSKTGKKSFHYSSFKHGKSGRWKKDRKILVKAECDSMENSARYVVTNLKGKAENLYKNVYNLRGDMENRIKEQKNYLFSDRTSSSDWCANQLRVFFSSLAYILLNELREKHLQKTMYAKAQMHTIRVHLLKIGAVVIRNTRRIVFQLSSAFPNQKIFSRIIAQLALP